MFDFKATDEKQRPIGLAGSYKTVRMKFGSELHEVDAIKISLRYDHKLTQFFRKKSSN